LGTTKIGINTIEDVLTTTFDVPDVLVLKAGTLMTDASEVI
jgi:hypothetical protein